MKNLLLILCVLAFSCRQSEYKAPEQTASKKRVVLAPGEANATLAGEWHFGITPYFLRLSWTVSQPVEIILNRRENAGQWTPIDTSTLAIGFFDDYGVLTSGTYWYKLTGTVVGGGNIVSDSLYVGL